MPHNMAWISFGLALFVSSIISCSSATAPRPGFESRITQKGLDFLRQIGIKKMTEKIYSMPIPSQSGEAHGVSYEIWNLRVTDFDIASSDILLKAGTGFQINLSGIKVYLTGSYYYQYWIFSHTGNLNVYISSLSTSFNVRVGEAYGRPTVHSDQCSFDAGNVMVRLHDGSSSHDAKATAALENTLNNGGCTEIMNGINEKLGGKLSQLKMIYPIRHMLDLDYSIISPPLINATFLDIWHKGELYAINRHEEAPVKIPNIPSDPDTSRMVLVWLTDYVANSAGYALHKYKYLQYNLTEKDIPPGSKMSLNTSGFPISVVFPKLTKAFPGKMMQITIESAAPPTMNTTNDNAIIAVDSYIIAYVIQPNSSLTFVFNLSAQLSLGFKFDVKNGNVTWVSKLVSSDVTLVKSAIKDLKIDRLKAMLPLALKQKVIPTLNKKGAEGIAIPNYDGVVAVNTTIQHAPGYLKLGTNFAAMKTKWTLLNFL